MSLDAPRTRPFHRAYISHFSHLISSDELPPGAHTRPAIRTIHLAGDVCADIGTGTVTACVPPVSSSAAILVIPAYTFLTDTTCVNAARSRSNKSLLARSACERPPRLSKSTAPCSLHPCESCGPMHTPVSYPL